MIGKEVLEKKPLTVYEVEKLLPKEGDLTYEQKATLDYVREVKKVDEKVVEEKRKQLMELGIDEELVVKILNVFPRTASELQAVLAKEQTDADKFEKILEILRS